MEDKISAFFVVFAQEKTRNFESILKVLKVQNLVKF